MGVTESSICPVSKRFALFCSVKILVRLYQSRFSIVFRVELFSDVLVKRADVNVGFCHFRKFQKSLVLASVQASSHSSANCVTIFFLRIFLFFENEFLPVLPLEARCSSVTWIIILITQFDEVLSFLAFRAYRQLSS